MSCRIPDAQVARMHADYSSGLSLAATARKHERHPQTIRELFQKRGLAIRLDPRGSALKLPNGQIAPARPLSWQEIDALIAGAKKLLVPRVLKQEWRHWSLGKRAVFVLRLRARLSRPEDAPATEYSANVVPFDYGSAEAWEIARRMNTGRSARTAAVKINLSSQGVIYRDQLWFWAHKYGYQSGPWTPENGRPVLHHVIWEETHGRAVPRGHVVVFLDGNKNNHAPDNLSIKSRSDLACENKDAGRLKRGRTRRFFQMHAAAGAIAHTI